MQIVNWIIDHWDLILFIFGAILVVAREMGWKKAVTVLTKAIEVGEKVAPGGGVSVIKSEVRQTSTPAVDKKLKPFILKAEQELGTKKTTG